MFLVLAKTWQASRPLPTDRDDPEIVVGGSRRILVVIRGVANLLPIGREGVVVLPAEREYGSVVVAGGEVAWADPLLSALADP